MCLALPNRRSQLEGLQRKQRKTAGKLGIEQTASAVSCPTGSTSVAADIDIFVAPQPQQAISSAARVMFSWLGSARHGANPNGLRPLDDSTAQGKEGGDRVVSIGREAREWVL